MEIFEIDLESSMSAVTITSGKVYCGKCGASAKDASKIVHKLYCPTVQQKKAGAAVFKQVTNGPSVQTNVAR